MQKTPQPMKKIVIPILIKCSRWKMLYSDNRPVIRMKGQITFQTPGILSKFVMMKHTLYWWV